MKVVESRSGAEKVNSIMGGGNVALFKDSINFCKFGGKRVERIFRRSLSIMICVSLFECIDGVDGKQARRTNSSTPLGELFDHGLDSWACIFFVGTVYSVFGRGESGVGVATLYYILWVVLFSFILSHWEKYNTGILFLPWGYDVSQVVRMHSNTHMCTWEVHTQLNV